MIKIFHHFYQHFFTDNAKSQTRPSSKDETFLTSTSSKGGSSSSFLRENPPPHQTHRWPPPQPPPKPLFLRRNPKPHSSCCGPPPQPPPKPTKKNAESRPTPPPLRSRITPLPQNKPPPPLPANQYSQDGPQPSYRSELPSFTSRKADRPPLPTTANDNTESNFFPTSGPGNPPSLPPSRDTTNHSSFVRPPKPLPQSPLIPHHLPLAKVGHLLPPSKTILDNQNHDK